MSLYLILGLDKSATNDEIKAAFRARVKLFHPDYGGDREKFERVKEAYRVLSDPVARARYDRTGSVDGSPPDPRVQAMQILSNWLRQIVDSAQKEPRHIDLIGIMQEQVGKEESSIRKNHAELSKSLHRLNDMRKRLSQGNGGPPFLFNTLDDRKRELVLGLRQLKNGRQVLAAARELLEDWDYEFEAELEVYHNGPTGSYFSFSYTGG